MDKQQFQKYKSLSGLYIP